MEFLIFWLATSVASFFMELSNELRMYKDAADAGYKVDIKRLSELSKEINPNAAKGTVLSLLIPIFNIMQVLQRTMQYNNIRPMMLTQLSVIGALEKMSDLEKEEYLKKPTGFNALLVPIKSEIRLSRASKFKIEDGAIFCEIGNSLDDITILKATGSLARLTPSEQKKKVVESVKAVAQPEIEEMLSAIENYMDSTLDGSKLPENDDGIKTLKLQNLSIMEQREALGNFKHELLSDKEEENLNDTDSYPVLSKRR